jgi:DNA polymerase phi
MDGASSGSVEANENEDSADEESSAEEDDDDDESDGDGETTTDGESIDEEFRNDVAAALGNALSQAARSDDDSDDESELMDDDEMLALDANLAAIFKRRTGKKLTRSRW